MVNLAYCPPLVKTPSDDGCVCCVVPDTPQGFTAYREWVIKHPVTGVRIKGLGYGWSLVNQSLANALALQRAQAAAAFIVSL